MQKISANIIFLLILILANIYDLNGQCYKTNNAFTAGEKLTYGIY